MDCARAIVNRSRVCGIYNRPNYSGGTRRLASPSMTLPRCFALEDLPAPPALIPSATELLGVWQEALVLFVALVDKAHLDYHRFRYREIAINSATAKPNTMNSGRRGRKACSTASTAMAARITKPKRATSRPTVMPTTTVAASACRSAGRACSSTPSRFHHGLRYLLRRDG